MPGHRVMHVTTDLARLFLGTALLAFASYTDWRWRRAPNVLWGVMLAGAVLLLAVDAFLDFERVRAAWPYLLLAPAFAALMLLFYQFHLIAGGADAKALMALAFLAPFPVTALASGLVPPSPFPGAFTVLGNTLLAFLVIPVALLAFNLARGDASLLGFLGYRKPVDAIVNGHNWPMEFVDDAGRVRRVLFPSRHGWDLHAQKRRLAEKGVTRVWVTPKIPFMIPLLAGFVVTFLVGDLLHAMIVAALGPSPA